MKTNDSTKAETQHVLEKSKTNQQNRLFLM